MMRDGLLDRPAPPPSVAGLRGTIRLATWTITG